MTIAGAGGDEWIYVLSQQEEAVEDAEAEQAVTAASTVAGQENNNEPSKNLDDDGETAAAEDEKASAQPPADSDNKAAQSSEDAYRHVEEKESPYPNNYTPEELAIEQAYRTFLAASRRATEMYHELEILKASRDTLFEAYIAADYALEAELEIDKAFEAYIAAFRRAADMAVEVEVQKAKRDKAQRAYLAAWERATSVDDGDRTAASAVRGPRVMENPYNDSNDDDDAYGGGSAPASLGYGYDNTSPVSTAYYNRYGFGFPGAYGYNYNGCYFGEPYAYPYVPGYRAAAAVHQAPPPAFSGSFYPLPTPNPYSFYPAPTPAPVSIRRPAGADEPCTPAVAPTTTTIQPLEPFSISDSIFC